ncbi:MAG: hypothetical protein ABSA67_09300 [Candidatus Brocadiia bacterium]|jgi:hypothetical protein
MLSKAHAVKADAVSIGFGRTSLRGTWATDLPFEDDIEASAVVLRRGQGPPVAVMNCDMLSMLPATCLRIRDQVARSIGTTPEQVGVFCTQNHGVPLDSPVEFDLDRLAARFAEAAEQALRAAQPASMAYVETAPRPAGVVKRRKRFNGVGSFTFYYGFDVRPDGRAGCAELLELALKGLMVGPEVALRHPYPASAQWPTLHDRLPAVPRDLTLDEPDDPLIQGIFFRTTDGRPLGSISRWAAHPITANVARHGRSVHHSGDYPFYLRRALGRQFGGEAVFFTGPCGDQAPLVGEKSRALAERTGEQVARQLLEALRTATWKPVTDVRADSANVALPVRHDYPRSVEQAKKTLETVRREFHEVRTSSIPDKWQRLKSLSDEIERLSYAAEDTHLSWTGLTVEALARGKVRHPLFALRIGDVALAGLPGEPFGAYSVELRKRCAPMRVIVAEECNGYLGYLPTAAEFPLGGYGSNSAIFSPDSEALLIELLASLIHRIGNPAAA